MKENNVIEFFAVEVPKALGVNPAFGEIVRLGAEAERLGKKEFSHEKFLNQYGTELCYRERAKLLIPYNVEKENQDQVEYFLNMAEFTMIYNRKVEHKETSKFVESRIKELEEVLKSEHIEIASRDRW